MQFWKKLPDQEIHSRIAAALKDNINFEEQLCLGIPASKLDERLFKNGLARQEPLIRVYQQNPNHIGCHTLGDSEIFFQGTQVLEKELIEILSVDLLKAPAGGTDGYVAAGGTEANLQAIWVYRNYYLNLKASHSQIAVFCSSDTHYSVAKACNLLHIDCFVVDVEETTRKIEQESLDKKLTQAVTAGKTCFIAIANMGTTMFGSVDHPDQYAEAFGNQGLPFFIHVDGAFGGFIFPVSEPANECTFNNPQVSSITLDAHKMLQAPYGTGVFIIKKGLIQNVLTKEAAYVNGFDLTVSGSRSGANAVAVWLLLSTYGPFGWLEKINKLLYRTKWLCKKLSALNVKYFNQKGMNIVTIGSSFLSQELALKYGLVPDSHQGAASWYKIVVMDHVELDTLNLFLKDLERELAANALVRQAAF